MALKDVDPGTTTHMSSSSLNTFLVAGRQQLRVKTRTGASMYFDYEDESGAGAGFFSKVGRHLLGSCVVEPLHSDTSPVPASALSRIIGSEK